MVAVLFLIVYISKRNETEGQIEYRLAYGDKGLEMLIVCVALLWLIPWGVLVVLPLALILSALSPAGRESWQKCGKIRTYAIISMIILLLIGGFAPTSSPKSPEEWGEPLFKENPNAPLYPAGQQYTWLLLPSDGGLNVEIVQSLSLRTPHQLGKFSSASSTLSIADVFDMQQSRMVQAIQLLDDQIVFDIDEDEMLLLPIKDKKTHSYDAGGEKHELDIRLYELRSLTLSSNPQGVKVGEVFCAAESSWGGELDILVVVRPLGHTGLSSDRYAESLTVQWIQAD
tara:strand:+ start:2051 stop:2905 length:855 start_codon:yes stop_codon:yes gene_type:complete